MTVPWREWIPGALNKAQVRALIRDGYIENAQSSAVDYSSFDLTLDDMGWEMIQGSVKPSGGGYSHFLETEKSFVGRVDVLARLIVDGMSSYEGFDHEGMVNASGQMYLEVTSMTFKVNVRAGTSLSQLRLFYGRPEHCEIRGQELYKTVLLNEENHQHDNCLRVDLTKIKVMGKNVSAFRAKSCEHAINLWGKKSVKPTDFWEFAVSDEKNRLPITATNFYILRSKERIFLPRGV